ncbi:MAG: ABC transporter ATP-binding protein [Alphaproteobacteria bacterium]|nr:ABC transporter ATP-binding protein [Alphaproteobacteria bacterium]
MTHSITPKVVWTFIFNSLRPFPAAITTMVLMSVVWAVDLSLRPYILKVILDRLADNPKAEVFSYLAWPVFSFLLLAFLMPTVSRFYGYFVEIEMIPRLRQQLSQTAFGSFLKQSHGFFQNQFSGSLGNKINDLSTDIPDLVQTVIDRCFSTILALIVAIITLWTVNTRFALLMGGWTLMFFLGSLFFSKRLVNLSDVWSEYISKITGQIVDSLSNILSVRLFARSHQEALRLEHSFDKAVSAEKQLQWTYFWIWFIYGYSFFLAQGFNIYFLMKGYQEGIISVGDFALVLTINIAIVEFLWNVTKDFSQLSKSLGKITQALRTITLPVEIVDHPQARSLQVTRGEIEFKDVKFHYKGTSPLFDKSSIVIRAGEKVGLVGFSGSGKTTFVNLILRMFDVSSGHIFIDGQDIREVTQDSLHQAIGMIPQDPSLFNRSLMENIRFGQNYATDEDVKIASKKAYAHLFIKELPEKYDTLVGERGVKLSGGQRQRIAIARVVLKNAPILILDEATSQLDSLTETLIQDSIWDLMQGKTALVIAHRLSTLLNMDRILVFDKGKIVQDGTHQQLLEQTGLYKTLWAAQVGGFLPEDKKPK